MHLTSMSLGGVPPFTELIKLKFDERVNLFVGPNASGKSTILTILSDYLIGPGENGKRPISQGQAHLRAGLYADDELDEIASEYVRHGLSPNVLTASEDWVGSRSEPIMKPENPPTIHVGSVRQELPGISDQEDPGAYGETAAEALDGPFSGSRTMCASRLLGEELWRTSRDDLPRMARVALMNAVELADACSKRICDEVIQDSISRNYIPGPHALGFLLHPHADPSNITILRLMGINTTDTRNFENPSLRGAAGVFGLCRL